MTSISSLGVARASTAKVVDPGTTQAFPKRAFVESLVFKMLSLPRRLETPREDIGVVLG